MTDVILYSTGCPKCEILKKKLTAKNIPFVENNDVSEMQSLGMMSAPALMVDGQLRDFMSSIDWVNRQ